MKALQGLVEGYFLERPNRFFAFVEVGSDRLPCFVPNPGRMEDLLQPRRAVVLRKVQGAERKTAYDLVGIRLGHQIVSIDSRLPNRLVRRTLEARALEGFSQFDGIEPEYGYRGSRLDFLLKSENENKNEKKKGKGCLLEVKSCTLVKEGKGLFPDAPTERGRRHLEALMAAREEGYRAAVIFIIQRIDAEAFSPNDEVDPRFGIALRKAFSKGVEVYAYTTSFDGLDLSLERRVPVQL